jgi:hypothetical protein
MNSFITGIVNSCCITDISRQFQIIRPLLFPNFWFFVAYCVISTSYITQFLFYVPLLFIQYTYNTYHVFKLNRSVQKLFRRQISFKSPTAFFADALPDCLMCTELFLIAWALEYIFKPAGMALFALQTGYLLLNYSLLVEGLSFINRLQWLQTHCVYTMGYGAIITAVYYVCPNLYIYYIVSSILFLFMSMNSINNRPVAGPIEMPLVWIDAFNTNAITQIKNIISP